VHNPVDIIVDNFVDNGSVPPDRGDASGSFIQSWHGVALPTDTRVSRET
jgi:hypothetical protein